MTENDIPENIRNRVHSKEVERLLQQVCTENNSFHMRYLIRSSADFSDSCKARWSCSQSKSGEDAFHTLNRIRPITTAASRPSERWLDMTPVAMVLPKFQRLAVSMASCETTKQGRRTIYRPAKASKYRKKWHPFRMYAGPIVVGLSPGLLVSHVVNRGQAVRSCNIIGYAAAVFGHVSNMDLDTAASNQISLRSES